MAQIVVSVGGINLPIMSDGTVQITALLKGRTVVEMCCGVLLSYLQRMFKDR